MIKFYVLNSTLLDSLFVWPYAALWPLAPSLPIFHFIIVSYLFMTSAHFNIYLAVFLSFFFQVSSYAVTPHSSFQSIPSIESTYKQYDYEGLVKRYLLDIPRAEEEFKDALREPIKDPLLQLNVARVIATYSVSNESLYQAAGALSRLNIMKVDASEWFFICHKIALRGGNATPCADALLKTPTFKLPLSGKTLIFGSDYALTFLLHSMKESVWHKSMSQRLWQGYDPPASQLALLTALFYSVSLSDDALILMVAEDARRPTMVRERAQGLIAQTLSMSQATTSMQIQAQQQLRKLQLGAPDSEDQLRLSRQTLFSKPLASALVPLELYTFLIRVRANERWDQNPRSR